MVGSKKVIALCTSRIYDLQIQAFIEKLNERLNKNNCSLWIYAINSDLYWNEKRISAETHVFDLVPYDLVDAVIIMDEKIKSRTVSGRIVSEAADHGIPVIVVDGFYENAISISYDYPGGFEKVVRHVIEEHGVRHPHFMGGAIGNKFSEARLEVFKRVLEDNSIPFDDSMVSYGEFWATPARQAAERLIKSGNIPEAVICGNDIMAINVCDVFMTAGIDVPGDVIVTGFDGYDEALMATPALTTASCRTAGLADITYKAVDEALSGCAAESYTELPVMITNESCGCPRCRTLDITAMKRFNNSFYRYQDDIREHHVIAAGMQSSESTAEMTDCLRSYFTRNMCCIVNEDCFRPDINYFLEDKHGDKYCILYDSENESNDIRPFDTHDVIPELEKRMESGFPLIFNALDYVDKPFGYSCYLFKNYDITEYSKTASLTDTVNSGVGGYVNMRYQQYLLAKVEEMYKYDALTGLYNRLAFRGAFETVKNDPANQGLPMTVVMADLDHLKMINDTLGHGAGDKAIATVAHALKEACPSYALCVRYGGDEMLAFIPGDCDGEVIINGIADILKRESAKSDFAISASCGSYITSISEDIKLDEVIKQADDRMYLVKTGARKDNGWAVPV